MIGQICARHPTDDSHKHSEDEEERPDSGVGSQHFAQTTHGTGLQVGQRWARPAGFGSRTATEDLKSLSVEKWSSGQPLFDVRRHRATVA